MWRRNPQRQPFTSRPLWRDWLVGYVLVGVGFAIFPSQNGPQIKPVAYGLMLLGGLVLLAALIHVMGTLLRQRKTIKRESPVTAEHRRSANKSNAPALKGHS
jgi:hypothetical protein